jgi:hypothetical protein
MLSEKPTNKKCKMVQDLGRRRYKYLIYIEFLEMIASDFRAILKSNNIRNGVKFESILLLNLIF